MWIRLWGAAGVCQYGIQSIEFGTHTTTSEQFTGSYHIFTKTCVRVHVEFQKSLKIAHFSFYQNLCQMFGHCLRKFCHASQLVPLVIRSSTIVSLALSLPKWVRRTISMDVQTNDVDSVRIFFSLGTRVREWMRLKWMRNIKWMSSVTRMRDDCDTVWDRERERGEGRKKECVYILAINRSEYVTANSARARESAFRYFNE